MERSISFAVTVRALIVDQGELLMVKHRPEHGYYALPGGKLEIGETLEDGLERELVEELNIKPEIGPLLFVNQWVGREHHRVEFFFLINNGSDYRKADLAKASHGFEIADLTFADAADPSYNLMPDFLRSRFARIVELGRDYPIELMTSR